MLKSKSVFAEQKKTLLKANTDLLLKEFHFVPFTKVPSKLKLLSVCEQKVMNTKQFIPSNVPLQTGNGTVPAPNNVQSALLSSHEAGGNVGVGHLGFPN